MPIYTFIPDEHDFEPERIEAGGPQDLLSKVYGYGWNKARVLQDDEFVFIVSCNTQGVWSILPSLPAD